MRADVSVHEPKQTVDDESALAFTMEGSERPPPGALLPFVWSPGWNSNQSLHKFQSEVGGPLRGGTAGTRLLDNVQLQKPAAVPLPAAFAAAQGEWLFIARHRIFGSDELSVHTPSIRELAGAACIEMRSDDAAALGLDAGDGVMVAGQAIELEINDSLPAGCASFYAGYVETEHIDSGERLPVTRADNWVRRQPQLIGSDRGAAGGANV